MPFVSEAQRRLCWLLYNKAKAAKKKPGWNCHTFAKLTKGKLPYYKK